MHNLRQAPVQEMKTLITRKSVSAKVLAVGSLQVTHRFNEELSHVPEICHFKLLRVLSWPGMLIMHPDYGGCV